MPSGTVPSPPPSAAPAASAGSEVRLTLASPVLVGSATLTATALEADSATVSAAVSVTGCAGGADAQEVVLTLGEGRVVCGLLLTLRSVDATAAVVTVERLSSPLATTSSSLDR